MRDKRTLIVFLMFAAAVLAACGSTALAQTEQPAMRTLQVNGSSQVFAEPDMATIHIGVRTEGEEAAKAVAENNARAQQVFSILRNQGVAERDIQTSSFNIYLRQDYDNQGRVTRATYVVENMVLVKARDLDKLGELLDRAVASGANTIHGIQFDASDKESLLSEARKAAVDNARSQAEELAQAAGVRLGPVQSINAVGGVPRPVFVERAVMEFAPGAEVPISPGQVSVTVDVTVVYEIR